MFLAQKKSFATNVLRRWYWPLAGFLTAAVWLGLAVALRPIKDADGAYSINPYGLSSGLENRATDLLFQLRDVRHPDRRERGMREPITIIEIDDQSITRSAFRLQKWPRDLYARLIDRANKGGARVVGLDIYLSEAGGACAEDLARDQQLAKAMQDGGDVVIASKLAGGGFAALTPLPEFREAAYQVGFADVPLDSDEFVRSSKLVWAQTAEFSFATRLAEAYLAGQTPEGQPLPALMPIDALNLRLGQRTVPLRNDRNVQIDYRARTPAFRVISAADLLFNDKAQIPDDLFRDRIVLIGAANIDAPDLFPTPFYESSALIRLWHPAPAQPPVRTPGVEIHAAIAATLLFGETPVRPRYFWQVILLLLPLALAGAGLFRLRALWGLLGVVVIGVLVLIISSWVFNAHGLILPLASAWIGLVILAPLGLGLRYAHERVLRDETEADRAQVMDILSRCVSEEVAQELWESRDQIMTGERRMVTTIFTDIRNFTTISESASSDQIVVWLNDYFSRMQAIVTSHRGHINKFLGDGLMIVFGAPASRGDEAEAQAAVTCGLEMLAAVEKMNNDWQGTGRPVIKIGVGIHSGIATCGVVGAESRLEYTLIGDTVNLASRLESTTKEKKVPLLASEATVKLLKGKYECIPLGEVTVKGKNESTKIYAVKLKETASENPAPSLPIN
jgi:adenylate cyclase